MGQFRVLKTCLLLLLASTAVPAAAADMDIYGNAPPAPPALAPTLQPGPDELALPPPPPQAAVVNDGGYGAGAVDWQNAIVGAQRPVEAAPLPPPPPPPVVTAGPDIAQPPLRRRVAKINPYEINGFDDGVFALKPTLQIGGVYSNNVNLTHDNRKSDAGIEIRPSLTWGTNWPVHSWTGNMYVDWQRFLSTPEANRFTGAGNTTFHLDISRDKFLELGSNFAVTESNAGSNGVSSNAIGSRRDVTYGATANYAQDFGYFETNVILGMTRANFGSNLVSVTTPAQAAVPASGSTPAQPAVPASTSIQVQSNSAMDYTAPSLTLRGTMGSPKSPIRPYAQISYDVRLHDVTGGNSDGMAVALGAVLNDGPLWTGDISGVMMYRHFQNSAVSDILVPGVIATVNWSPAPLWNFTANSGVVIVDSGTVGGPAIATWTGGLTATWSILDNVNLRGGTTVSLANDSGGGGLDLSNIVQFGADWLVSPHMMVSATAQSGWYTTPVDSQNYDEQRVFVGVTWKP